MFDGFLSLPVMAVAAFFGVSYFVNPGTIIIQDISVPHALEDSGFTHEVAAAKFTEQLSEIADSAGTNRGNMTTELTAQGRSVEALSDWFGLASPIRSTQRSEEHTSELQSLMRISYAVFCLKKKN